MQSKRSFAAALAATFLTTLVATHLVAQNAPSSPATPQASPAFVGSDRCAACHQSQHAAWKGSQHAHAMAHARGAAVLGDFSDATFTKDGIVTTFFTHDGRYFVRTVGPDGKPGDFEITFTFGVEPLQQYLVQMPGGRLQAFGIAWDTRPAAAGGQRWFDLYPGHKLASGDPLHWTGIQQTANFMCIDCHVTNSRKNFDSDNKSYASTWTELGVGCEACHGPGGAHVANPRSAHVPAHWPSRLGIAWGTDPAARPKAPSPAAGEIAEVETCARCHARRSQLTDDFHAGQPFGDGFRWSLLEPGLYWPDGQMQDEVFNYGSFLHSRMFSKGVTCSDCHDPHSQKLRADGNAVCAQCHDPVKYQAKSHHFHAPDSPAGQCVSCHMPTVTYMVVDPRHDHSFRVPRPDLSIELGTPDVCTECHRDKPAGWAAAELKARLGHAPSGFQTFGVAFHASDQGAPGAASMLARIAADPAEPSIVRASAITRAVALRPTANFDYRTALRDPDPVVRAAAAGAVRGHDAAELVANLAPLLHDSIREVRIEAAAALAGPAEIRLLDTDRAAFKAALDEYIAVQRYNADRGEAHMNLALLEIRRGNRPLADAHLERAIATDPTFVPAYVQLADLYRTRNEEARADELLRQAVQRNQESALAHHSLGLSLVRQRRLVDALPEFARAAGLEPDSARFGYVYAVALDQARRKPEALRQLDDVLRRHPYDARALEAAAAWAVQRGETQTALSYLMTLRALRPDDPNLNQQIEYIRGQPSRP